MNTSGEAADQVVRYSLEAGEVALKITGKAAKEIAVLLYTILKEEKKTKGKAKLETLLRSGKPLSIFSVKEEDMKKFEQEAKSYGIMYYPIPNSNKGDGMYDVMVKEEDAPRINRLVERFKLSTVNEEAVKIKAEIEKARDEKGQEKQRPEKSKEDILVDELLGESLKKEKTKSDPVLEKTGKSRPSEHTSEKRSRTGEGTSKRQKVTVPKKPSVKKELETIKKERKQETTQREKTEKSKSSKNQRPVQHKQPAKKKPKQKER